MVGVRCFDYGAAGKCSGKVGWHSYTSRRAERPKFYVNESECEGRWVSLQTPNMPVIVLDRLPLPSLRAYTLVSVVLLSCSVYYAVQVTSDPVWKANSTLTAAETNDSNPDNNVVVLHQRTPSLAQKLSHIVTFMIQEPLCIWVSSTRIFVS